MNYIENNLKREGDLTMANKGKIYYKIVDSNLRCSYIVQNDAPKYCLDYQPNTIVHAIEGSMGIMCFKTYEQAKEFRVLCGERGKIIKVRGIGRPTYPKFHSQMWSNSGFDWYYHWKNIRKKALCQLGISKTGMNPEGTICFKAVEVLD